jgi:uncharacterized protein (TIGR02265 family)
LVSRRADIPVETLEIPEGFAFPAWESPLDVDAYLRIVPPEATVKGLFLMRLIQELERAGKPLPTDKRYFTFHDYSLRECMELLALGAPLLYPEHSVRNGIRRLAWLAYGTFTETMIGRVIFGLAGTRPGAVFRLAPRGLSQASSVGKIVPVVTDRESVVLRISQVYCFPDCFGVGMAEGVLDALNVRGYVAVRMQDLTEGEIYIRWL